jgi:hypothetical protein
MSANPLSKTVLRSRIESSALPSRMDKRTALVWHGYLGAAIEWGLVSVADHHELTALLPALRDNPVIAILSGPPEDRE